MVVTLGYSRARVRVTLGFGWGYVTVRVRVRACKALKQGFGLWDALKHSIPPLYGYGLLSALGLGLVPGLLSAAPVALIIEIWHL